MKGYLFDASSILTLAKKGDLKLFENGVSIELAYYEAVNSVWKEHSLFRRIDEETAIRYLEVLSLILQVIDT